MKYLNLLLLPVLFICLSCEEDVTCTTIGAPCDDGMEDTYNDAYDADCNCVGNLNLFTDPRDGQSYKVVKIGSQTWMQENFNYESASGETWCFGDNNSNCDAYGKLYDWETAGLSAPGGWHLPADAEWTILINFLGGEDEAGGKLKEAGNSHWSSPNTGATNESGFTALPCGARVNFTGYLGFGSYAYFWSSTESSTISGKHVRLGTYDAGVFRSDFDKDQGASVRLLRD